MTVVLWYGMGPKAQGLAAEGKPFTGKWVASLEKLDNGEQNKLFIELEQHGSTVSGRFHTLGYGGTLKGTVDGDKFTVFAPWDERKPFCKGEMQEKYLRLDLGRGTPVNAHPETAADLPPAVEYITPPALHPVPANGLAKTPPMGWNSWNRFGGGINDGIVREVADAMVATGMRDAGYLYINIDDTWEGKRDENGVLHANSKFPDMKGLADYVHARGLKLGIYSSPGPRTCGGYPGSYGHEQQDARLWASWGIDYLKYDWCSAETVYRNTDLQAVYQKMGEALATSGRPILYSLCEYGMEDVWKWGPAVGANLWRTTGDIRDEWVSMADRNGFTQNDLAEWAGPGHWNDPDMLEVGNGHMTAEEYRAHMSLWSLLAAPLLAGNDVRAMTAETKSILMNREVIAIDQDPLGRQGTRLYRRGEEDVWAKPLAGGAIAVGIFNRGDAAKEVVLKAVDLKLGQITQARDLWKHEDVHFHDGAYSVHVPSHGVVLLRVR